jgi:hypothetical protein
MPSVPSSGPVSTGAGVLVAPMVPAMGYSTQDVTINAVADAQQSVSIGGINYDFTGSPYVFADDAAAKAFLELFTVTGNSSGPTGGAADLSVAFADSGNVAKNAIKGMIDNSLLSGSNLADTLSGYSNSAITAYILNSIGVSIDAVNNQVTVDSDGGAAAAVSGLSTAVATSLYLQIGQAQLQDGEYYDSVSHAPKTSALPLFHDDKIVLVFDVAVSHTGSITLQYTTMEDTAAVQPSTSNGITVSDTLAATNSGSAGKYAWHLEKTPTSALPPVRVAFALQMPAGSGAFSGLKA